MKIIMGVVGSRNFTDRELMRQWIEMQCPDEIVSGGAPGADTLIEDIADELNIPITVLPANWRRFGKAAGFIRNADIVERITELAAFFGPQGPTPGTSHTVALARANDIPVNVFTQEP